MKGYNLLRQYKESKDEVIEYLIENAIDTSHKINNNTLVIGVDCSVNPEFMGMEEVVHNTKSMWAGFIRDDVKVVYKFIKNNDGYTVNEGCYYYMKDNQYLYDFASFIIDKDINNDYEFMDLVLAFLDGYLYNSVFVNNDDTKRYPLLYDSSGRVISDSHNHSIADFYNDNSAQCSEYSAMASNILSTFGYNVLYLGGSVNTDQGKGGHAYNIAILDDGYAVLDFSIPVSKRDYLGNAIGVSPFIGFLEEDSMNYISDRAINRDVMNLTDYEIICYNEPIYISFGKERQYVIGNVNCFDRIKQNKKTY